jgi:Dolichyl-phosphate-mannose-protein mannosyltransferase
MCRKGGKAIVLETDSGSDPLESAVTRRSVSRNGARFHIPYFQRTSSAGDLVQKALVPFIGTRLALLLVGLLAKSYIVPLINWKVLVQQPYVPAHFPAVLWEMWERFDTGYYIRISMNGYWPAVSRHPGDWGFYPLFPLLTHPLGILLGGSRSAFGLAGFVISNIAALIAVSYMYLLVRRDFGEKIGSRAIVLLGFFPTAFYLSAVYSESVLLACCASCLYYGRERRWWLAGLCGGLGALARAQGVILLIPLAWEFWRMLAEKQVQSRMPDSGTGSRRSVLRQSLATLSPAARDKDTWLSLLGLALIPMGLLVFMLYAKLLTGDFLMPFHSQDIYWGRHLVWPWQELLSALRHPRYGDPLGWNFWPLNMGVTLSFLALTVVAFRKLPAFYALYMLGMVLLPLSSGSVNSIGRYSLIAFPAFILLALWDGAEARPWLGSLILGLFAALQALFMMFFVLGVPAIA